MNYDEAVRWLAAIGGTHEITREGIREIVVVRVSSANRGDVVRRTALDRGISQELAGRRAFVLACDELRRALS